jgi:hypothetical protein
MGYGSWRKILYEKIIENSEQTLMGLGMYFHRELLVKFTEN